MQCPDVTNQGFSSPENLPRAEARSQKDEKSKCFPAHRHECRTQLLSVKRDRFQRSVYTVARATQRYSCLQSELSASFEKPTLLRECSAGGSAHHLDPRRPLN